MVATRGPGFVGRSAERALLDGLLARVRAGESEALVIRGEAGVGKTALLRYAARQASGFRVAQLTGVEAEMELPFAGIHQLCAAMPDRLDALPAPQRDALSVALGLVGRGGAGPVPRRTGRAQPAVRGGGGAAAAVSRRGRAVAGCRLEPDPRPRRATRAGGVGGDRGRRARAGRRGTTSTVCPSSASKGCPSRMPARCWRASSRAGSTAASLTGSSPRPAGTRSPCWSCPARMTAAELAGGFELPAAGELPAHIEDHYLRRVGELPEATQRLMLLAAAEPLGDAALVLRAARRLDIEAGALGARRGRGAAGDRGARPVPPSTGALGGLPSRATRQPAARARSPRRGERSGRRRRSPRVAPRAGGSGTGRGRRRRARASRPAARRLAVASPPRRPSCSAPSR